MKTKLGAGIGIGALFDIVGGRLLPGENVESWSILIATLLMTWAILSQPDFAE